MSKKSVITEERIRKKQVKQPPVSEAREPSPVFCERGEMMKSVMKSFIAYPYSKYEKKKIIEYMTKFDDFAIAGLVNDYFTKKELQKDNLCYSDGKFVWCTQDIYHISEYNATIADDFFKVALEQ